MLPCLLVLTLEKRTVINSITIQIKNLGNTDLWGWWENEEWIWPPLILLFPWWYSSPKSDSSAEIERKNHTGHFRHSFSICWLVDLPWTHWLPYISVNLPCSWSVSFWHPSGRFLWVTSRKKRHLEMDYQFRQKGGSAGQVSFSDMREISSEGNILLSRLSGLITLCLTKTCFAYDLWQLCLMYL